MHKILIAAVIAGTMLLPTQAEAGRRGHGAGIALGVMGAIIGGAIIADQINRDRHHRRHRYNEHDRYYHVSRQCADRWGWNTWRWERCMNRRGY
jgi:hypothetical protein